MISEYQKTDKGRKNVLRRVKKYQASDNGRKVLEAYKKTKEYRDSLNKRTTEWQKRNPLKVSAHNAVYYAIKSGKLKKKPCEVCGSKKVQAHHDDYYKPLKVRWFCDEHHKHTHYNTRHSVANFVDPCDGPEDKFVRRDTFEEEHNREENQNGCDETSKGGKKRSGRKTIRAGPSRKTDGNRGNILHR